MVKSRRASKPWPHEDAALFRQAVASTAGVQTFAPELIEKDYWCSVVLRVLYDGSVHPLIFKGGTLLNKAYTDFSRLSEDLDFSISVEPKVRRVERSGLAVPVRELFSDLPQRIPGIKVREGLKGSNESRQYKGTLEYRSVLRTEPQTLRFEVGLREVVYAPDSQGIKTLVQDPFRATPLILPFKVTCLSRQEAYAEKLRAALTRETAAIRDLYDIDRALTSEIIDVEAKEFRELVGRKLKVQSTPAINISEARRTEFKRQMETDLRPVLRPADFERFDFDDAWATLLTVGRSFC